MTPNPHLQPLAVVIGTWTTQGTHPMLPGETLHGRTTFEWVEDGAFLLARSQMDRPEFPAGISIFGTDDARPGAGRILYFDSRGVSREYAWTLAGNLWTWSRPDPVFSQRMQVTIGPDGRSMVSIGEMSRNGASWEPDLSMTFTRAAA